MSMVYRKLSIIILKIRLLFNDLVNNVFLIALGILMFALAIDYYYLLLGLGFYLLYLIKKNRKIGFICLGVCLLFCCSYFINETILKENRDNYTEGIVISIKKEDDYQRLIVLHGLSKSVVYDNELVDIEIGDFVKCSGESREIKDSLIPNGFNQHKYYKGIRVNQVISAKSIEFGKSINMYVIRKLIYRYVNFFFRDYNEVKVYILALVFGDSSELYEDDLEAIKTNGISHLFAISGLHISIMVMLLSNLLIILKVSEKNSRLIISIFLIIYMFVTNFMVSVCRAGLLYILHNINEKYKFRFSSLDLVSILFIIFIICNPSNIYNLAFVLSFLASFAIILFSFILETLVKKYKLSKVYEIMILTVFIQIVSFPIVINISNSFNLLSFCTNVFFIVLISYIILPCTLFTTFIPLFKYIFKFICQGFSHLNVFFSKYLCLNISLPTFSHFELIGYYLILIILFAYFKKRKDIKKVWKKICLFGGIILFFFGYYEKVNLNISGEVVFLDIYEGDSTVINLPLNQGIMVIDTGTGKNEALSAYLKSIGVRKIDVLLLTHSDNDHNGEALVIQNNFCVNKTIISAYDNSEIVWSNRVKAGDYIVVGNINFEVLSPRIDWGNPNDNSLVLYGQIGNMKYLFLGDISSLVEDSLIGKIGDVDVVKVAHHGSSTSSSAKFYQSINPKYVIIETGHVKLYGFPHSSVIEVLSKYKIYRTDLNKSIIVKYNKKRSIISPI